MTDENEIMAKVPEGYRVPDPAERARIAECCAFVAVAEGDMRAAMANLRAAKAELKAAELELARAGTVQADAYRKKDALVTSFGLSPKDAACLIVEGSRYLIKSAVPPPPEASVKVNGKAVPAINLPVPK